MYSYDVYCDAGWCNDDDDDVVTAVKMMKDTDDDTSVLVQCLSCQNKISYLQILYSAVSGYIIHSFPT